MSADGVGLFGQQSQGFPGGFPGFPGGFPGGGFQQGGQRFTFTFR